MGEMDSIFETCRLSFRTLEPEDEEYFLKVENDSREWLWGETVAPLSRGIVREYCANYNADPFEACQIRFMALSNTTGERVGMADLYEINLRHGRGMIGIYTDRDFRNCGYGKEMICFLIRYSREILGLHQLAARVLEKNEVAGKTFRGCGFMRSGCLTDWMKIGRNFENMEIYNIIL